ncbi:hypothetical protein IMZ31_02490 [Pontibacillus sp. ALD_SL1]|uniref:hypothetical protein n=1 Tax=Pontibacillus sp. ALD_SL1 TaxID=2777185 RepID=UPI001A96FF47|nr:hypothetical protein [Pontibacillus sp. ALD_SL1]QST00482.1 hypothetical protein IMZ31_02490 [Pontibacillus sp. ALD_SL1]
MLKKKLITLISVLALTLSLQLGVEQDKSTNQSSIETTSVEIMTFSDPYIKGVGK